MNELQKEWYDNGKDRGYNTASWCDIPEIGSLIDRCVDWVGYGDFVTKENQQDYFGILCHAAEENSRQFSPFEFTAHEINSLDEWESHEAWEAFDEGISDGISKYILECEDYFE